MYRVMSYPPQLTLLRRMLLGWHYTASNLPCRSWRLDEYRLQTPVCPLLAQSGHANRIL